jgi:hypothetical protein
MSPYGRVYISKYYVGWVVSLYYVVGGCVGFVIVCDSCVCFYFADVSFISHVVS